MTAIYLGLAAVAAIDMALIGGVAFWARAYRARSARREARHA